MKKISLIPDFLQSEKLYNPIVSTKHIINIIYNEKIDRYNIYIYQLRQ